MVIDELQFRRNTSPTVRFTDRITGETFSVPVALALRQGLSNPHWSPDGGRLLLTTRDYTFGMEYPFTAGFVIVDVAIRRTSIVRTFAPDSSEDLYAGDGFYAWCPVRGRGTEGAGVLAGAGCGRVAVASAAPCAQFAGVRAVTLLAALLVEREREVTDAPADLLIATVHRIPLIVRVLPVWVCPSQCSRRHLSLGFGAAPPPRWAEGP
ncbi:hypothetical protein [Nonomuraea basaltis]|uniref:hypothetical protein n=1 Tax=Nonomuraea basaltis TaxID=2495887 RepID=UPI00110C4A75|nr:hypothetical protein [Nonomuraea basaltis]TMR92624.1 hypothetical protein EJK15_43575 [Nonomuraea basaltis]